MTIDLTWQDHAACAGDGWEAYFGRHQGRKATTVLLARCHLDCPVQAHCLNHAVTMPEVFGMWGGFTEQELFGIRTKRFSRCGKCGRRWPKGSLTEHTVCRWCEMDRYRTDIRRALGADSAKRIPKID